ncbi:DNA gyrase subunit A (EC [uncultured Gammaproteobacteria bacterium]|jgi:DNA gyrase subunit A|uniref:DNA gyrase subunit A n=1 Tax=thiotrophic endosymbiont of Bathymodiolus puteoserpentis (Logatchev) TaxID=343240 RepID=UPI0010B02D68|nr:DNA gyrase subunit A [thiotrophic endosymbiont of Bathymodiolus puteoserpentis (Logatchev)]CAC9486799.1 DNA gyrase subunit A (EC 5.99.1.3) [uncultured Gammaproteobacteria bacterium]CAC9488637.1 DNA gyrase subunit A (EC 5.99.1.3) [uncultured Gammaproteobacteria bacterium]CAC9632767.1 DNA gyrase subunit A (EC 5.99.1.3) [uncultured Gammaproteobacteria bacterium]SSC10555.1 DNA gyrase subunit A [thiotrophic endosymbiont of Bathymodiolus puteoserpentis (Logatchev)]VVH51746.1 DNA gyrase subunit A 
MSENIDNPEAFTPNFPVVTIEDEMRDSYLEYAMSVIVGRALPDVRDGLKPVHRRVLYAMDVLGNDYNKAYKKSARIVGDVIGKYHPHGDTAVYDTIVRMAQPFSMRSILIDGQGNFGSVDGDRAAAMRYTEIRMTKLSHELLRDLDKQTVDFIDNYDGSESEPSVLPTRVPNLLVNGSSGIAVGMATNIPPHNLGEVVDACLAVIDKDTITLDDLLALIPGPDFPTAGIINGASGIRQAYETGKGKIYLRSVSHVEGEDKQSIVVTELPYQVNKAKLITKIAELVKDKKVDGITGLRDESDKDGMRMVIELRRGEVPEVMLNNLYKLTEMQTVFGINMVAIDRGMPKLMTLRGIIDAFIAHRRDVVTRRSIFELNKARSRAHILEGLSVALTNIDEIIEMIKAAPNPAEAKIQLASKTWIGTVVKDLIGERDMSLFKPENLPEEMGLQANGEYQFSPKQAQAILDLKLHRLTGLEKDKIFDEFNELLEGIKYLLDILQNPEKLMQVIRDELIEIRDNFANGRLTEIIENKIDLTLEDLIAQEERVVTLSHGGYVKAQSLSDYQAQRRGGKGKAATKMKDEDFVDQLFVANSHDTVLCFSSMGKVHWLKVYELPMASRTARGKPIINLLPLEKDEVINAILPVDRFTDDQFVFMVTSSGTCKKTSLTNFSRPRKGGIIAIELRDGDKLVGVDITSGENDIMLFSANGKSIRFRESDVRAVGRTAIGVRGMKLKDDEIVSAIIADDSSPILTATEKGYGKRTNLDEYRAQARGGSGVISIKTSDRNGKVVGAIQVTDEDEMMLISNKGTLVRARANDVSIIGRNTQGVTLIKIAKGEKLVSIAKIAETEDEGETPEEEVE